MKRIIALLMVLILVCGTPLSAYAQPEEGSDNDLNEEAYEEPVSVMRTIYVSATGDDSGNGSSESPYRTIEKARQEVAMISGNMSGDIIVSIADGDYYLEDILQFGTADSGTNGYCIRYKAEGSNSVISGGREVIGTWKDEGNGIFSIEYVRDEKLRSLYVNGQRAYMSSKKLNGRGGYGSYSVKAGQADWAWIDGSVFQGTLFDAGSIPLDTRNPDDIELQTQTTWNTAIVSVDNLEDCGNGKISANLQMPYGAIAQKPSWGNNYKVSGEQTVYNVFEWLDEPGEFYFDKSGKRLYYYPREGENLETAQVVVPELQTLVNIQGESTENRVHNISFEGLTFAHTDWN